jgi:hypothetical protein
MDVSDLVTEQKAKHAEFEVDDKSGIHLVVKAKGGKVLADVIVGKTTGPGTMVRPTGKDEVWQATGISRYLFDKSRRRLARQEHHHVHAGRRRADRGRGQGRRQDDRQEDRRQGRHEDAGTSSSRR